MDDWRNCIKALQFPKIGAAQVIDVPVPKVSGNQVLIKVGAAGVCYSDIMAFKGLHPYRVPPVITGHEAAGEVVSTGDLVKRVKIGDRVAVEPHAGCGACWHCRHGQYNLCADKRLIGVGSWMGAFSEFMVAEEDMCFQIPSSISDEEGATIEPFAVGFHAVRVSGMNIGQTAAILGCGTIGMMTLLSSRIGGAVNVLVSEPSAEKRRMAQALGADRTINPLETDPVAAAFDMSGGKGIDTVFVTVSGTQVLKQALLMCRRGGTVVVVAVFPGETPVELWQIQNYERKMIGTNMYTADDYIAAIELYKAGKVDLKPLITNRVPIEESPAAIRALADGERPDDIKTVFLF